MLLPIFHKSETASYTIKNVTDDCRVLYQTVGLIAKTARGPAATANLCIFFIINCIHYKDKLEICRALHKIVELLTTEL